MSHWIIVGGPDCRVAEYVTYVVSEEGADGETPDSQPLRRWVVEACEGQIQQLTKDPHVVRITWERR